MQPGLDRGLKPIDRGSMSFEELYDKLIYDHEFIDKHKTGKPVYTVVSYMLASMEVLIKTPYIKMLKILQDNFGKLLINNDGKPDPNMGRYSVNFYDTEVGELCIASQKWIDRF